MEFAASIPADLKIRGREKKWILREAMRGWLPDEILDRPKQGFSVPVGEWFRHDLRSLAHDVLLDPPIARSRLLPVPMRSGRCSIVISRGPIRRRSRSGHCSCSSSGIESSSTDAAAPRLLETAA